MRASTRTASAHSQKAQRRQASGIVRSIGRLWHTRIARKAKRPPLSGGRATSRTQGGTPATGAFRALLRQDPLDQVLHLACILGCDSLVFLVAAVDLDLGALRDHLGHLRFGVGVALVLGGELLVRGTLLVLVDGVALRAAAFLEHLVGGVRVGRDGGQGKGEGGGAGGQHGNQFHRSAPGVKLVFSSTEASAVPPRDLRVFSLRIKGL